MRTHWVGIAVVAAACGGTAAVARSEAVSYRRDDATLRAVACEGDRMWACGDRGTLLRSDDGGSSWREIDGPAGMHWRGVSAASGRTVFVGTEPVPPGLAAAPRGRVVIVEDDEPRRTREVAGPPAYRLSGVRAFDRERWAAWGEGRGGAGLFLTEDGGGSWRAVEGASGRVGAAAFANAATGVLLGDGLGLLRSGTVRERPLVGTGWSAAAMETDGRGWLVGDRGRVRRSDDFGATWSAVDVGLPDSAAEVVSWRGVATRADLVCVVGSAGGAVLRSEDGGATWTTVSTGLTTPLHAVEFADDSRGVAVGAFGAIVATEDGGATWRVARGGGRRAAYLAVHSRADRIEATVVAAESELGGFRGVVHVAVGDGRREIDHERICDETLAAGADGVTFGTGRTLRRPGVESDRNRLVADWRAEAEGRGEPLAGDDLVAAIRAWRPDVLVVEGDRPGDALAEEVSWLALRAAEGAADATRLIGLRRLGLRPWGVRRVVASAAEGTTTVHRIGPRTGDPAARAELSRVSGLPEEAIDPIGFRVIFGEPAAGHGLFGGLAIGPGTASRRAALFDPTETSPGRSPVTAIGTSLASGPEGTWMAAAGRAADRLSDAEAVRFWRRLGDEAVRGGRWADATVAALRVLERGPRSPEAGDLVPRVLTELTSPELGWRRDRAATRRRGEKWLAAESDRRDRAVDAVLRAVAARAPALLGEPAVTAAVGATRKRRTRPSPVVAEVTRRIATAQAEGTIVPVSAVADRAGGVVTAGGLPTPPRVGRCRLHANGPVIDGEIVDDCWATADPLVLVPDAVGRRELATRTLCWLAGDRSRLVWAGSVPVAGDSDQVALRLDLDGDGATFWKLAIARDGAVTTACGDDPSWSPRVATAVTEDDGRWRFEVAVSWDELGPERARVGTRWSVAAGRRVAAVGTQSWGDERETPAVAAFARPGGFATLRFEAGGE